MTAATQPSDVQIVHGIPSSLRAEAARLYWQAFGPKLGLVLGPEPRALHFLARAMRPDNAFAAISADGALLGIAGFRSPLGSFAGGSAADLRHVYGRTGAAWRSALLSRLAQDDDDGSLLIEGVCVAPSQRGRGIGRALVAALCDEGRRRGLSVARLDVVAENLTARHLYERMGFVAETDRDIGMMRHLFGYRASVGMVRRL